MKENNGQTFNVSDVSIVVISCDAYKDLWKPFFYSFHKYWPDCPFPVFLASNECKYEDSKVKPILIGPDKDYSSNLLAIVKQVGSPWLILWLEDVFIISKIDTARIKKLIGDAQNDNAGYLKLITSTPWALVKDKKQEIGPIPKGVKYRSGLGLGLWNKETLLKLLKPGESAWQIDRSNRSNSLSEPFYALTPNVKSNPPVPVLNSVIKGRWNRDALSFLAKEGLEEYIVNRQVQSFRSYLYMKLYLFRLDLYRRLGKYWYD